MQFTQNDILTALVVGSLALVTLGGILVAVITASQHRFITLQRQKLEALEASGQRLKRSYEQLRKLSARLQTIREEERRTVAREVHDELGQMMSVLKMDIALISRRLKRSGREDIAGPAVADLDAMTDIIDRAIGTIRRIAKELRPELLDELGLTAAMESAVASFQTRSGIASEFISGSDGLDLDPGRSTELFRILQEALTNIARHAGATRVSVSLRRTDGDVVMEIRDDGKGITKEEIAGGDSLGILGMQERAFLIGGEVTIGGEEGKGTTVKVSCPLAGPPAVVNQGHVNGAEKRMT